MALPTRETQRKMEPQHLDCDIPVILTEEMYSLKSLLGKGTFGTVTLAEQKQSGKLVAIKSLKGCEDIHPYDLREVEFFRHISAHSSLVNMGGMYIDSLTRCVSFVLEVMDITLLELITARRGHYIDASVISSLAIQLLQGIQHIHLHKFVHRDIKPENLLLKHDSKNGLMIKIADFGLSRKISTQDFDHVWTGYVATRWYRAPEQLLQMDGHGYALDIWALGAVLAEMCNLRPLFPGKNMHDTVRLQLHILGNPSDDNLGGSWILPKNNPRKHHLSMLHRGDYPGKSRIVKASHLEVFDKMVTGCLQWNPRCRPTAERLLYYLKDNAIYSKSPVVNPKRLHVRSHSVA